MLRPYRRLIEVVLAMAVLVVTAVAMGVETVPIGPELDPWFDTSDRDDVLTAYRAEFGSDVPSLDWQGDHERCDAGSSSRDYRQAAIRRVNYYRAMAGVRAAVVEDPAFSVKAQRAAMMMSVEGSLSHDPPSSYACFSAVGHEAASNSNLYLGRTGPRAVDGYIEDPGDHNVDVGHRTTILHPPTRAMGVGDVDASLFGSSANALWVFDDRVFDEESPSLRPEIREEERFIAWPPRGYVPPTLVHPRWSFTLAGADFTEARVAMYRPSAGDPYDGLPLEVVNRSGARGHVPLPTIVWQPTLDLPAEGAPASDELYLVVVSGVRTGADVESERSDGTAVVSLPADGAAGDEAASADDGATGGGTSFAYAVRVLGDEPSDELTAGEFLDRLGTTTGP